MSMPVRKFALADATLERPTPERDVDGATASTAFDDLEVDGDATILIPTADLPAGTEHLQRPSQER